MPKIAAPANRGMRDKVNPRVIAEVDLWKSLARSDIIKVIEKKSKASQVQARKAT